MGEVSPPPNPVCKAATERFPLRTLDLPDDATPVDVIVAFEGGGDEYSEVGRTRIHDPS